VSPASLKFHYAILHKRWYFVLYADRIDVLYSIKDLVIRAEHHERQVRRLEQERDAMEAKYEVRDCLETGLCS